MCGINGFIDYTNAIDQNIHLQKMNDCLQRRGPDKDGTFFHKNTALGHRRLSIIDLSDSASQPMSDHTGRYHLVFNGEIYNFQTIKKELQTYKYQSNSDTEVLIAAYQKWGVDCLQKFEGMFAFALYDKHENSLFIGRDRLGIKPVYYHNSDKQFVFSSEIKGLLASELVPKKVNKSAIIDFINYQTVHAPHTIINNVYMLMPAHFMMIKSGEVQIKKYWQLPENLVDKNFSYKQIKQDIKDLFYASIEKRMISDVPLGAFLSGGIDSSIVTGVMSELSLIKINTFSVNFDEAEFSEGKYARLVASKFNTNHTEIILKPSDFLDSLPDALAYMDHPSGDGPNSYIVSKATKEAGITVALSGLGGDEIFAGYDVFKQMYKLSHSPYLRNLPKFVRKSGSKILPYLKKDVRYQKYAEILKLDKISFHNAYPISRLLYNKKELKSFIAQKELFVNKVHEIVSNIPLHNDHVLSSVSNAEINTYLQNVLLRDTDQMSMANSLEVRVPFLDYKLIEYVYQVPDKFKYPHSPKKLLTDSINILPEEIINRPKMGFLLPWEHWLKNELFSFSNDHINSLAARSFFNEDKIRSLWKAFQKGDTSVSWARLWIFIVLEDYIQKLNLEL